jgi:flagellar hook-basal body complex protein FliE
MTLPVQGFPLSSIDTNPLRPAAHSPKESGFASTLEDALDQVEDLQANADQKVSALLDGNGQDIHGTMIAVERADLSFQLMLQVRNKIVNAYQEVARMQF